MDYQVVIKVFHFVSYVLVGKLRTLGKAKLNHSMIKLAFPRYQEPKCRENKEGSFCFRCWRKFPEDLIPKKTRAIIQGLKTESRSCTVGVRTRALEVEGEERYH